MRNRDGANLEAPLHYPVGVFLRDVWRFLRPYRWRFVLVTFFRVAGDLAWLYPAFAFASVVTFLNRYHAGTDLRPLVTVGILWAVAIFVRFMSQFSTKLFGYQISERVALDAELTSTRHLFALPIAWHEKENTGNKMKRLNRGGQGLDRVIRTWFNSIIEIAVNFVGTLLILAHVDGRIAVASGLFLILYFLLSIALTRRASLAEYQVDVQEEVLHGQAFELLNNIRTVKVLDLGGPLYRRIEKIAAELFRRIRIRVWHFQIRSTMLGLWGHAFRFTTLALIAWGILHGRYELGFLILFNSYFWSVWESVSELSDVTQDIVVAKNGIARMMAILNEPIEQEADSTKVTFPKLWQEIRVEHLSFAYDHVKVLRDVSFTIRRGERIGIVGLSGAGKSTLFKLLLKERETYSGRISIDNVPLRNIARSSYFRHVAVVLQDTEVFNLSVQDNIAIAGQSRRTQPTLLRRALQTAHVEDFVNKLPQGLHTLIGEKGVKLSGGEKQRVGIARAIYKKPEVLLLDEATSHLDLESEQKIRDSLHTFFQNVTAIVIAHRLTTIREMNRILVIENGKLIEQGSFDELYGKQGRFYELWEKQRL